MELRPGNLCSCPASGRSSWERGRGPLVALLTWVPCLAPCDLVVSEGTPCSGTRVRPGPGWVSGGLLSSQRRFSFSHEMPRSPPRAQVALSGEAQPCAGSQALPSDPAAHGSPGDGSSEGPQHHPRPQTCLESLLSLCSQVASLLAVSCDTPSAPVWKCGWPP